MLRNHSNSKWNSPSQQQVRNSIFQLVVVGLASLLLLFSCGNPRRKKLEERNRNPLLKEMQEGNVKVEESSSEENKSEDSTNDPEINPPPQPELITETIESGTPLPPSNPLLETGVWVFNVSGKKTQPSEAGEESSAKIDLIKDLKVRVLTRPIADRLRVEIYFAGDDLTRRQKARAISGWVTSDPLNPDRHVLRATGNDEKFEFQIIGTLRGTRKVEGMFLAVDPDKKNNGLHGKFSLEKYTVGQ